MAPHLSTLAWRIPQTEEPGGLQSMGSLRVRHEWATSLSLFTFMHWRRKWQPTPVSLPGESQGRGAWWAAVYEVAQSRIRLKWLSSSSRFGTWQHWHHEYSYNYYVAKNSWVSKQTLFCHCIYQIWCIIHTHTPFSDINNIHMFSSLLYESAIWLSSASVGLDLTHSCIGNQLVLQCFTYLFGRWLPRDSEALTVCLSSPYVWSLDRFVWACSHTGCCCCCC